MREHHKIQLNKMAAVVRSQVSSCTLGISLFLIDFFFFFSVLAKRLVLLRGLPVSQQGQGVTRGLLLTGRNVRRPGSERRGPLSGLDAVNTLKILKGN